MANESCLIIYGGLSFLLGALITGIINHFLSKDRERQIHRAIAFHEAAEKFRHSFDDALLNIDQGEHAVTSLLKGFFIPHKIAMWHFKYYLTGKTRDRFEQTWNNYEQFYNENYEKGTVLGQFGSAKSPDQILKLNEFRQHIENLFKFTM